MGAFGAISSFASRRRGRCCVRLAGIAFCTADEPTFWPRSDYGWFFWWVLDVDADGRDGEIARADMLQKDKSYGVVHGRLRGCTMV